MSRKYHVFTEEEDKVILSNVESNIHNLHLSFKKSAEELNLTYYQVYWRYYRHLRYTATCFLTVSERRAFLNRKVIRESDIDKFKSAKPSLVKRIINNIKKLIKNDNSRTY